MWVEIALYIAGMLTTVLVYKYMDWQHNARERLQIQKNAAEKAVQNAEHTQTNKETMKWLNFIIKKWYLHNDGTGNMIQTKVKEIVQPILNNLNMGLEFESMTFGQSPPYIGSVRSIQDVTNYTHSTNLQGLQIVLNTAIEAPEFQMRVKVAKGFAKGCAIVDKLTFTGELKLVLVLDNELPLPGIKSLYITFEERPDINFDDISVFGLDIDYLKNKLKTKFEEILCDTLVDPGRFFIDMSKPKIKPILIRGVRKLKRTVLHIQVEISNLDAGKEEKRKIKLSLNSGGSDHTATFEFCGGRRTHHVWYPLAVTQEKVKLKIKKLSMLARGVCLADIILDISHLPNKQMVEKFQSPNTSLNLLTVVKVETVDLPHIPIRQGITKTKVVDHSQYFEGPVLTHEDVLYDYVGPTRQSGSNMVCQEDVARCPSGLLYLHIHRATELDVHDTYPQTSDPYLKVSVQEDGLFADNPAFQTEPVKQDLNPIFDHFEDFFVRNILRTVIKIEVYDKDDYNKDDHMGEVTVNLAEVLKDVVQIIDREFEILTKEGEGAGRLYISVIFRRVMFPSTTGDVSQTFFNNLGKITTLD